MKHRALLLMFALMLLVARSALAASSMPRILLSAKNGYARTVTKPRNFFASAHYRVTQAHWITWNRDKAVARATLTIQFPSGPAKKAHTTITYSRARNACGTYTYTRFSSASGAKAKLAIERGGGKPFCIFVIQ